MAGARDDRLFRACRENDISTVRNLLPQTSFEEINRQGPDGQTCLHIASSHDYRDLMGLLVEHGALRQLKNKEGLTCFQVAKNEEVFEAFGRQPDKVAVRYRFDFDVHPEEEINWLFGQNRAEAFSRAIHRGCMKDRGVRKTVEKIESAKFIPLDDESKEGKTLRYFLNQARQQNDPTFLLRIYTIDGIFYTELNRYMASGKSKEVFEKLCHKWSGYYAGCLMKNPEFIKYHFAGVTHRGMIIDREAFKQYEVGVVVTNKTFQSSSKLPAVALKFAKKNEERSNKLSVLIQYTILERRSALDIKHLSEFPEEEEVLMVPGILFKVDYVDGTREPCRVHLRQLRWDRE